MALGKETGKKMRFHGSLQLLFMVVVFVGGMLLIDQYSTLAATVYFFLVAPIISLVFMEKYLAVRCTNCGYNYFGWRAALNHSPFWASKLCRNCDRELP